MRSHLDRGFCPAVQAAGVRKTHYCKAKEISGDVLSLIKDTGKDGKMLLAQLRAGYTCLDDEAYNALRYASGVKPKKTHFID